MKGKTLGLTVLLQHQKYQSLGADNSLELAYPKNLHGIAGCVYKGRIEGETEMLASGDGKKIAILWSRSHVTHLLQVHAWLMTTR